MPAPDVSTKAGTAHAPVGGMLELRVASEIDAPAETIWKALTDLSRFGEWNPFIRAASGTPAVGATIHVRVSSSLAVPLRFEAKVLVCDENRELRWRGHLLAPWLASGEHSFTLEPAGDGRIRFVQHEVMTGLLMPFVSRLVEYEARRGFDAMNRALKARVEHANAAQAGN
jgi:hypothetical protein